MTAPALMEEDLDAIRTAIVRSTGQMVNSPQPIRDWQIAIYLAGKAAGRREAIQEAAQRCEARNATRIIYKGAAEEAEACAAAIRSIDKEKTSE